MYRCPWCEKDELYRDYHDNERWIPVHDDRTHFEFLLLESFQAGLSWYTILKKRDNFRQAFDNFDPVIIASYDEKKFNQLLTNTWIIRHRGKIQATITNAQIFLDIQQKLWSWDSFIWAYTNGQVIDNNITSMSEIPTNTPLSDRISKDLKKMGMKFVWSTTLYAYLQATGQVNDHLVQCRKHNTL
jgi:DNA-3-methyladenine glycosylase I